MGKIKYLSAFILFYIIPQSLLSQQYNIMYKVIFRPQVKDTIKIKENYVLKLNPEKKESMFTSVNPANNFNASIYKNFTSNIFIKYESILDNLYKIDYKFDENVWKLINLSKKIDGYNCSKAEINFGGRKWEAWYTSDVPFQDGPYKFSGLPGLILEIYSLDGDYNFSLIGLEKKGNSKISKLMAIPFSNTEKERAFKQQVISDPASEYRKQMAQLKNNNLGISVRFNGKEITSKETENRIIDDFKIWMDKHNNPIEKGTIWMK